MKSILIIGMGRFGHHLCENLAMLGNDVMVVDQKEEVLEDLLPIVTSAKIGDCTNEAVLRSLGTPTSTSVSSVSERISRAVWRSPAL